jgi:hypothetical protein
VLSKHVCIDWPSGFEGSSKSNSPIIFYVCYIIVRLDLINMLEVMAEVTTQQNSGWEAVED